MHMNVPDAQQVRAQALAIEAQKELAALKIAQDVRLAKAANAINFISLRFVFSREQQVVTQPEMTTAESRARDAAFAWLADFFTTDTENEAGQAVREEQTTEAFAIA